MHILFFSHEQYPLYERRKKTRKPFLMSVYIQVCRNANIYAREVICSNENDTFIYGKQCHANDIVQRHACIMQTIQ